MTGKIDANTTFDSTDFRNTVPRFSAGESQEQPGIEVDVIAAFRGEETRDARSSRACLVTRKEARIVPIPGTTKPSRPEENLGSATIELTVDEVLSLEEVFLNIKVEGARYSPFHQSLVGR